MVAPAKVGAAMAAGAAALSAAMFAFAFEPCGVAELAYVFAIPAIIACKALFVENDFLRAARARAKSAKEGASKQIYGGILKKFAPIRRAYLVAALISTYLAWAWLLVWLRHVYPPTGWIAVFGLPLPIAGLFMFPWFAALPLMLPRSEESAPARLLKFAGLAGLWVALEWARSWFLTGFPWLPLGNSQWTRAAVMQSASWGGVWILSFTLIFFNLAVAEYIYKLYAMQRAKFRGETVKCSKLTPEFYVALLLVMSGVWTYIANMPREENEQTLFKAGLVQPDFAGILKWSNELAEENLRVINALSTALKDAGADVLLWPEAATPPRFPINRQPMKSWIENLAKRLQTPVLTGNMYYLQKEQKAQNGAFFVSETSGLEPKFYAKTHLVPFGEYVPNIFGFLGKVVPVGDMAAGESFEPFPAKIKGREYKMGAMICYEDVFPAIGRKMANNGADIIFVCTNDSWYGREAGAWQHASHAAIQAAATRKIILRASNNGLSAVFDQYGRMLPASTIKNESGGAFDGEGRHITPLDIRNALGRKLDENTLKPRRCQPMLNEKGSIYFRGCGVADVVAYKNFGGKSAYVKYGDWVVWASIALCAAAAALSFAQSRRGAKKA